MRKAFFLTSVKAQRIKETMDFFCQEEQAAGPGLIGLSPAMCRSMEKNWPLPGRDRMELELRVIVPDGAGGWRCRMCNKQCNGPPTAYDRTLGIFFVQCITPHSHTHG